MAQLTIIKQVDGRVPRKLLHKALSVIARVMKPTRKIQVSVVTVSEKEIIKWNKRYRHKNKATDVLSFQNQEGEYLGDILICYNQARLQAEQKGHSTQQELLILVIHGVLHLLGYDHEKAKEAEIMEALEQQILTKTISLA